jgi:hypothetical protein
MSMNQYAFSNRLKWRSTIPFDLSACPVLSGNSACDGDLRMKVMGFGVA